jgi:hypothetical protein
VTKSLSPGLGDYFSLTLGSPCVHPGALPVVPAGFDLPCITFAEPAKAAQKPPADILQLALNAIEKKSRGFW